ncbi:MAG: tetratricopeptide repeat protein [Pirellulaceae bacterium]
MSRTASTSDDFATAERYLEQALTVADQNTKPSVLHDLAIVLASAGDFDKAESLLEQALQLRPDFTAAAIIRIIRQKRSEASGVE